MKKLQRGLGDITGWVSWVNSVISGLNNSGNIQDGELMAKYSDKFAQMAADVSDVLKDGFQVSDLVVLGALVPDIMKIADELESAPGTQKKQFVVDAVWVIYHSVDTGPDGKHNRIHVPGLSWLSKFGISAPEEKVERYVLKLATEMAVEAAYVRLGGTGAGNG
jgi:hypothetical protein